MVQSDVIRGPFVVLNNGGVVGRLARLAANATTGKPEAVPPGAEPPFGPYCIVVDATAVNASLLPLEPGLLVRLPLAGTCAVGDGLYVTAEGKAEKRTEPAAGAVGVAFAAEAGADGQSILARPHLWKV